MRIDAIVVLALGAINYLKFMVEVYDSAAGESGEDEPGGR